MTAGVAVRVLDWIRLTTDDGKLVLGSIFHLETSIHRAFAPDETTIIGEFASRPEAARALIAAHEKRVRS